jgi:hypothetical protein
MTIPENYEPNVPLPKNIFNVTQPQIQQNFETFYNSFSNNHVALDASSGAGNHTNIQLVQQQSGLQTGTGEISIYGRDVVDQTTQVFMRYQGNQKEFRYSNYQIYPIDPRMNGTTLVQSTYITFLPGNMLVYFGYVNSPTVDLNPFVAKHVLTANFCAATGSAAPPDVTVTFTPQGTFSQVNLKFPGVTPTQRPYYYIVVVNT